LTTANNQTRTNKGGTQTNLAEHDADASLVDKRTASQTNHLQHIRNGEIDISMVASLIVLRVHQHHEPGRQARCPGKVAGQNNNLNGSSFVKVLHDALVASAQAAVQKSDAVGDCFAQSDVLNLGEMGCKIFLAAVQELLGRVLGSGLKEDHTVLEFIIQI
jgi:hypothetical protein